MNYFGNETFYGPRKPAIIVVNPTAPFICAICNRKGNGPPNSVVHPGRCREEHNRRLARKTAERRREKKRRVAAVATNTSCFMPGDAGQKVE